MIILGIFKELRDVVIIQNDAGEVEIKGAFVDPGSEEEQEVLKTTFLSTGFIPKSEFVTSPQVVTNKKTQ